MHEFLPAHLSSPLYDMHCHLGFYSDPTNVALELAKAGIAGGLCCCVTPTESQCVVPLLAPVSGWRVGVGLHPWWASEADVSATCTLLAKEPCLVGEVGLDFGARHKATRELQLAAFSRVLNALCPGSVLSIHAVRAADTVLSLLEEHRLIQSCTCILHWYSDSGEALTRAVRAGCFFSVGPLMLRSRRGREYARQIPAHQLLLETDFPEQGTPASPTQAASDVSSALRAACAHIAELRGTDEHSLAELLAANSEQILAHLAE